MCIGVVLGVSLVCVGVWCLGVSLVCVGVWCLGVSLVCVGVCRCVVRP